MKKPPDLLTRNEPWVKLTRELLRSDAWRTAGVNTRRFIDFLMLEHMAHGGKENGKLKAPYRQLGSVGIGARRVAESIREAEDLGLVECNRAGMRVATTYGLTWLDGPGRTPAKNRWREYRNPDLPPLSAPKIKNLHDKGKAGLHDKGKADGEICMTKGRQIGPKQPENLHDKGKALSRKVSYQGGDDTTDLSVGAERPALRVVVGNGARP